MDSVFRGIMRSSRKVRLSMTPSPSKANARKLKSPHPSNKKLHRPSGKTLTKSKSENALLSSFRNLSVTPKPHPPSGRSRTVSPVKKSHSEKSRSFSTVSVSSIVDIANLIKEERCKNIIIMAGAGISTPSGIPDFRTPGTGLYDNLQEYNIPEPTAIFDIEYFWYDPRPFFCLAKTLYPGNFQPNYVHYFIKLLYDKGLLLKMYTQNIDGLERLVGLPPHKLVEAHGTFSSATCIRCRKSYDGESIKKVILQGSMPRCLAPKCKGIIKPDIVFFGEDLPNNFYDYEDDFPKCDLLIVMGTSLEVQPFAGIISEVKQSTPRLLINREVVGPFASPWKGRKNDVVLKGDVVSGIKRLVKLLEWMEIMDEKVKTETENWKNKKEAEKVATDKETRDSKECNSQSPNSNGTRGFHTLSGQNVGTSERTSEPSVNISGDLTLNSKPRLLFPRTTHSNQTVEIQNLSTGFKPAGNDSKQSLHACNSVARRIPLLPFRYTHRTTAALPMNFKSIDPSKDLASAGFGLLGRREKQDSRFHEESSSDSDSSSSSSDGEG